MGEAGGEGDGESGEEKNITTTIKIRSLHDLLGGHNRIKHL